MSKEENKDTNIGHYQLEIKRVVRHRNNNHSTMKQAMPITQKAAQPKQNHMEGRIEEMNPPNRKASDT